MEPSSKTVDWSSEVKLIKARVDITDDQVKEALEILEQAKIWYETPKDKEVDKEFVYRVKEIPDRIRLISHSGTVLHTVRTNSGEPWTKDLYSTVKLVDEEVKGQDEIIVNMGIIFAKFLMMIWQYIWNLFF